MQNTFQYRLQRSFCSLGRTKTSSEPMFVSTRSVAAQTAQTAQAESAPLGAGPDP